MGGASTVVENLVFSAGNGARVRSAMQWTKWQEPFNAKTKKMDIAKREESRSTHPMKKRERTEQVSERSIQGIQHPDASHFRSPVLLEVETDQSPRPFKILMLHAPGPQGKEVGQDPYAETYVKSVCEEAHKDGIDGVQGDLNIYSPLSSCGGYRDATEGCGGTTQNTTGRVSRLDRSMLGPGVRGEAAVNRKGVSTDVSDHFSLSCTVTVGDHQTGDSDRMDDE